MAKARLEKEHADLMANPPANCTAGPLGDMDGEWEAIIVGPEESPYAGGIFNMVIAFPEDYPSQPPKCFFRTKIYHCNVHANGSPMSKDLLISKENWKPEVTVSQVLSDLHDFLKGADPHNAVQPEIAQLLLKDPAKYDATAREWTSKYAY
mmetsp:Transcript_146247/g.280485  ORF Transcript_146247/g.280485 Transcript_146247/m.280485 type:complete len:151 (+) Transcript_146247:72-524(+)